MNANTEKTSKGKCTGFKCFVCCGPQKGRKQRKQPNEKSRKHVNCNPKSETTLMEDVPPKEVTNPFKEEIHTEEENNDHMNYENSDHINYTNHLVEKFKRRLSYEIQQFKLDEIHTEEENNDQMNYENNDHINYTNHLVEKFERRLSYEIQQFKLDEIHTEEENNDQMNYENNDQINYTNHLVEKFERRLSYAIQQFKLDASPSDTPLLPEMYTEVKNNDQINYENNEQINYENNDQINYVNHLVEKCEKLLSYEIQQFKLDTSPSKAPLFPVQKSSKLRLPLDQHLLDQHLPDHNDWIYKKYLDEEFKILIPYEDEETKHDKSSWTTSILYSLPVGHSSSLRLLLNQLSPENDPWHLPPGTY